MRIVHWRWRPGNRTQNPGTSTKSWSAIAELGRALAGGEAGSLQLFEKLTGNEQLWWRCCRDAAQSQPYWLLHNDHYKALQVISDTEPLPNRGAISRAAEAADLICRALAEPADIARPVGALGEAVARAAECWDGSPAVLVQEGPAFTPEMALASTAPWLRDRAREVLACLDSVSSDARQAMVAICTLLLAAIRPDAGRIVSVSVVFARPDDVRSDERSAAPRGVAGTLELREFPPGPVGLFPDPRGMRNRRADPAFAAGLSLAWQFAAGASRSGRCVLWRLSLDDGVPDYAIDGGSLGAAFAVALRELLRRPRGSRPELLAVPRAFFVGLRPGCAITGVLATQRPPAYDHLASQVADGPWLDQVGDMDAKLEAAGAKGLRLVAPAGNRARGKSRATVPVDWAVTVHQADRYARRVRPVRTAITAAVLLAVAGTSAGIGTAVHYSDAAARNATSAAQQQAVALSRKLAAESIAQDQTDPKVAGQLATAAWKVSPTGQAKDAMLSLEAGQQEGALPGNGGVNGVAFSPDGKLLATADQDGTVQLWNTATGQPVSAPLHSSTNGGVNGVAFSPDGKLLATADQDGTTHLWNTATGQPTGNPIRVGSGSIGLVESVVFSPGDTLLATADFDGTVQLWDPATGQPVGKPITSGNHINVTGAAFSPDGKLLAIAYADGATQLWDPATGRPVSKPITSGSNGAVVAVAFSPDGKLLATVDFDGATQLWDPATGSGSTTSHPVNIDSGEVWGVAFSPNGKLLATTEGDGTVQLWGPATGQPARKPITSGPALSVAFNPSGTLLATGDQDGTARLWSVATGQPVNQPITPAPSDGGRVWGVAFSSDGKLLATADDDGTARLWNTATGQPVGKSINTSNSTTTGAVTAVAFSPGGTLLATAYADGAAQVWNTATGQPVSAPLHSSTNLGVNAVAFSPDGTLLATAGDDGTLRLWDPATGQPIGQPITASTDAGGNSGVHDIAFSPDGKLLATTDGDDTTRLWGMSLFKKPYQMLCNDFGPVSQGEWDQYAPNEPLPKVCS